MVSPRVISLAAIASLLTPISIYVLQFMSPAIVSLHSHGLSQLPCEDGCDFNFIGPDIFNVSQPQLTALETSAMELSILLNKSRTACAGFLSDHIDEIPYKLENTDRFGTTLRLFYALSAHDLPAALSSKDCAAIKGVLWRMGSALMSTTQELETQFAHLWQDSKISVLKSLASRGVYCSRWNVVSHFLADIWLHFVTPKITFQHSDIDEELTMIGKVDACQSTVDIATTCYGCWKNKLSHLCSSVRNANDHLVRFWDQQQMAADCNDDRFITMAGDTCARILVDFQIPKRHAEQKCLHTGSGSQA